MFTEKRYINEEIKRHYQTVSLICDGEYTRWMIILSSSQKIVYEDRDENVS